MFSDHSRISHPCRNGVGGTFVRSAAAAVCLAALAALWGPAPARADSWSPAGTMSTGRNYHTATLLPNGKVLVVGGQVPSGGGLKTADVYDPATNAWSPAAGMDIGRSQHTATLLANGKVLVAGGYGSSNISNATAELYDPATNTWSPAASMGTTRAVHTATLLPSGKVLVTGGFSATAGANANAETYDPAANTWTPTANNMTVARTSHQAAALASGKVLVTGGTDAAGAPTASADVYDAATNTFTPTATGMVAARSIHSETLLPNGKVIVAGGFNAALGLVDAAAQLYDPGTNAWSAATSMNNARGAHTATLLTGGLVLAAGGIAAGNTAATATTERYWPATGVWLPAATMASARSDHTATRLGDGRVLVAGGVGNGSPRLATAEIYSPLAAPRINTVASASIVVGSGTLTDTASVSGLVASLPGATITWWLYGPNNPGCTGAPAFGPIVTPYPAGGGLVTSPPFTPTLAGNYVWVAKYSGDANNAPSTGSCDDQKELVTVQRSTPRIVTAASPAITLGGKVTDAATVTALVNPQATTITWRLYGPDDATCSSPPVYGTTMAYTSGSVTAPPFMPALPGTYRWRATYNGDVNNTPVTGACDDPAELVRVSATAPAGLDHFKCYTVKPAPVPVRVVTLTDQFLTTKSQVHEARQLCNPVRKALAGKVTEIANPTAHLVCRRTVDMFGKPIQRNVRLRNQFGIVDTRTTGAVTLCVPSLKKIWNGNPKVPTGPDPEKVLDHFRCYDVKPRLVPRGVVLRDQFGEGSSQVVRLVRLCNPVRKTYQDKIATIKRPEAHLACYTIVDKPAFKPRDVVVGNQFGGQGLRAEKVESLCLPTFKQELPDVWGKDTPADVGDEPSSDPVTWASPDIRVRNGFPALYGGHQNPIAGQQNSIFVTVRNRAAVSAANVAVKIYWANAATGIAWQTGWTLITTVPVASVAPGSVVLGPIPWVPTSTGHLCMLVRMVVADDPIGTEVTFIDPNTRNNNNIIQKNLNVVAGLGPKPKVVSVLIRNPLKEAGRFVVRFREPRAQRPDPFLGHGRVVADLSSLARLLKRRGARVTGMRKLGRSLYRVMDPAKAAIHGLPLEGKETKELGLRFSATSLARGKTYSFDLVQEQDRRRGDNEIVGGVRYALSR